MSLFATATVTFVATSRKLAGATSVQVKVDGESTCCLQAFCFFSFLCLCEGRQLGAKGQGSWPCVIWRCKTQFPAPLS